MVVVYNKNSVEKSKAYAYAKATLLQAVSSVGIAIVKNPGSWQSGRKIFKMRLCMSQALKSKLSARVLFTLSGLVINCYSCGFD